MQEVLFNNIQDRLIAEIRKSTASISIAVAWFNNRNLFDCLIAKTKAGVKIKMIIINDEINNRSGGLHFQKLIDHGVEFYFASTRRLMHHKFCVIDDLMVFNGSYNWTYAAESRNNENVTVLSEERGLIQNFQAEFERITSHWEQVKNVDQYLLANPPSKNLFNTDQVLLGELIGEVDVLIEELPMEVQIRRLEEGTLAEPDNAVWKEKLRKKYLAYSKDLAEFCTRYPHVLFFQIGKNYQFNHRILELYSEKLTWSHVQWNQNTSWNYEMILPFKDKLLRTYGSAAGEPPIVYNRTIQLTRNQMKSAGYHLTKRFEELKKEYTLFDEEALAVDEPFFLNDIPVNFPNPSANKPNEIDNHTKITDFGLFGDINWTEELLTLHIDQIDFWGFYSRMPLLPWTSKLLLQVCALRTHQYYMFCEKVTLTAAQLEDFKDILDWKGIAGNNYIDWSLDLFERYKDYLSPHLKLFSKNKAFPWTAEFVEEYQDQLSFENLSANANLPWTEEFVLKYAHKWHYGDRYLCSNEGCVWTENLLELLKNRLDWDTLARNRNVPWNLKLMATYAQTNKNQYFVGLAYNQTVWENVFKNHVNDQFLIEIAPQLNHDVWINDY